MIDWGRVHVAGTVEMQDNSRGDAEEFGVDLLLFTNRCVCRVRQDRFGQQAVHLAYLGQSIPWMKHLTWTNILGALMVVRVSRTLVWVPMSQAHWHPASYAGNPARHYKTSLGWVPVPVWQASCLPLPPNRRLILERRTWQRTFGAAC